MATKLVDVIIPVYRNAVLTRTCIESVLSAADPLMGRVIVINDASPEAAVNEYCAVLEANPDIELITHDANRGFVASVNEGMQATVNDVVLLNSDTEVAGDWLTRLHHIAQSQSDCSTVTPFSNNATICSFPVFCEDNPLPAGVTLGELDSVFSQINAGQSCEIPTGVGFCMYVTRASLIRVGEFDEAAFGRGYGEENDFCRRAVGAGFKHYHCADVFVRHTGGVSFSADASLLQDSAAEVLLKKHPDYDELVQAFIKRDPARSFRERVTRALEEMEGVLNKGPAMNSAAGQSADNAARSVPLSRAGHPLIDVELSNQVDTGQAPEGAGITLCLVVLPGDEQALPDTWQSVRGYPWSRVLILCGKDCAEGDICELVDNHRVPSEVVPAFTEAVEPHQYWTALLPYLGADECSTFVLRCGSAVPSWLYNRLVHMETQVPTWAFPLSAMQPFSRIFRDPRPNPQLSVDEVDAWLNCCYFDQKVTLPMLAGYSALIKSKAGFSSGSTDDFMLVNDLKAADIAVLLHPEFYIDDSGHEPLLLPPGVPSVRHEVIRDHPRFGALSHVISTSELRGERAPSNGLSLAPATLHVCHSWGGGLNQWVEDYGVADPQSQNLILKSVGDRAAYGRSIALFSSQSADVPIKVWSLVSPILATDVRNAEYGGILEELASCFQIKQVLVSSLIGHSLEVLDWHSFTTVVAHDFYPLCPPLYAKFGRICDTCEPERFRECLNINEGHQFFNHESPKYLADIKRRFLRILIESKIRIVAPSHATRERWLGLAGCDGLLRIDIIPHGLRSDWIAQLSALRELSFARLEEAAEVTPASAAKLRVLVLGRLFAHKGSDILRSALPELREFAEIHLLGAGDEAVSIFGRRVDSFEAHYKQGDLPSLIEQLAPDVAVMLSTVPETFSYTAEELQLMGIPVVTTNVGSLAERIDLGRTGWDVEPNPESLVSTLSRLQRDRGLLLQARRELLQQPAAFTASEMVHQYSSHALSVGALPLGRAGAMMVGGTWQGHGEIYVRPDIPVRQAVFAFIRWLRYRLAASPRVPAWLQRRLR